jgi:hypothetical protein
MHGCDDCLFTWRSTELGTITNAKLYPARFKVNLDDLKDIPVMPDIAQADK